MGERDDRSHEPTQEPEPSEAPYEPPRLEEIRGDDRAVAGAWITGFPDNNTS
jgi:hypothetical protein